MLSYRGGRGISAGGGERRGLCSYFLGGLGRTCRWRCGGRSARCRRGSGFCLRLCLGGSLLGLLDGCGWLLGLDLGEPLRGVQDGLVEASDGHSLFFGVVLGRCRVRVFGRDGRIGTTSACGRKQGPQWPRVGDEGPEGGRHSRITAPCNVYMLLSIC